MKILKLESFINMKMKPKKKILFKINLIICSKLSWHYLIFWNEKNKNLNLRIKIIKIII